MWSIYGKSVFAAATSQCNITAWLCTVLGSFTVYVELLTIFETSRNKLLLIDNVIFVLSAMSNNWLSTYNLCTLFFVSMSLKCLDWNVLQCHVNDEVLQGGVCLDKGARLDVHGDPFRRAVVVISA